jgi:Fe-S cluster biosynthesis and repair protein YggX
MKKRTSRLEGSVIPIMNALRDDKKLLYEYFYWDSPVFKEIRNHIDRRKTPSIIEPVPNGQILVSSAHGAVSFKDAWVHSVQFNKADKPYYLQYYTLEFEVHWLVEDEYDRSYSYRVEIPFELEDDFTEKAWEFWVQNQAAKIKKNRMDQDMPDIKKLVEQYPDEIKKLLEEQK